MSKRITGVLATGVAALLAASVILVHDSSVSAQAAVDMSDATALTVGCTSIATAGYAQIQGTASPPLCTADRWVFDLPSSSAPASTRRTEAFWGTSQAPKTFHEGDTVTYEAEYTGVLGAAGQGDSDWHVLWQLHGPVQGSWPGPAMGLAVRNRTLRFSGGDGHVGQNWSTANYEWIKVIAPWKDGQTTRIKVQTYLSSDPNRGWVSAWVNGVQVLNQWQPVSAMGLKPATIYAGTDYLVSRTGLYRGTQAGSPPNYRQVITARVIRTS